MDFFFENLYTTCRDRDGAAIFLHLQQSTVCR